MMNEQQALEYIHARPRLRHGDAAQRMPRLLELLGHPEKGLPFVHVTGTNGKGSFCAMTASMLTASGKKTGLFISPYIVTFHERMQIDGENIPGDTLARLTEEIMPAVEQLEREGTPAGEFMLDLALALKWFQEEKVDFAVIEAGIGGAGDATIALPTPALSVIMGIGLEHTALLGPTLSDIARDKAAIIKGNPALLYPDQPPEATAEVMRRCAETGAKLHIPSLTGIEIEEESLTGSRFCYDGTEYTLPLAGRYQIKNAVTALWGARLLGIDPESAKKGLATVKFPARMQCVSQNPWTIVDGAHNPHGMRALRESLEALAGGKKIYALVGMMEDKAVEETLSILGPVCRKIFAVTPDTPRAMESGKLRQIAGKFCADATDGGSWKEGYALARTEAGRDGALLLVCGSLYLAGDLLREASF